MKTILLITEQYDPTADNLIQVLRRRGCPVLRWNLDCYPKGSALTYRASAQAFEGAIATDGRVVPFDEIGSVWYRALRCSGFPPDLDSKEQAFAAHEAESMLNALSLVTDWHWVNDPRRHRDAAWKPEQLSLARRLGLTIPRTVITNDPDTIKAFREQCGGTIIYKPLSHPIYHDTGETFFTSIVTDEALTSVGLIQHTPGIFQELVPKDYEIRLTVVEDKMMAVKILSQQGERTKVDWRVAPYDVKYEPIEVPGHIRDKVTAFMAESGLVYSCLDFIVTPEGGQVFLESNPRGQYLWIEDCTDLPITEAIADALTASPRARTTPSPQK